MLSRVTKLSHLSPRTTTQTLANLSSYAGNQSNNKDGSKNPKSTYDAIDEKPPAYAGDDLKKYTKEDFSELDIDRKIELLQTKIKVVHPFGVSGGKSVPLKCELISRGGDSSSLIERLVTGGLQAKEGVDGMSFLDNSSSIFTVKDMTKDNTYKQIRNKAVWDLHSNADTMIRKDTVTVLSAITDSSSPPKTILVTGARGHGKSIILSTLASIISGTAGNEASPYLACYIPSVFNISRYGKYVEPNEKIKPAHGRYSSSECTVTFDTPDLAMDLCKLTLTVNNNERSTLEKVMFSFEDGVFQGDGGFKAFKKNLFDIALERNVILHTKEGDDGISAIDLLNVGSVDDELSSSCFALYLEGVYNPSAYSIGSGFTPVVIVDDINSLHAAPTIYFHAEHLKASVPIPQECLTILRPLYPDTEYLDDNNDRVKRTVRNKSLGIKEHYVRSIVDVDVDGDEMKGGGVVVAETYSNSIGPNVSKDNVAKGIRLDPTLTSKIWLGSYTSKEVEAVTRNYIYRNVGVLAAIGSGDDGEGDVEEVGSMDEVEGLDLEELKKLEVRTGCVGEEVFKTIMLTKS